jgi:RNA polymerase sigma-70 factor (ECF subfamily)
MDDLQAILRVKQGDLHGLETLIARHQVKAVRIAYLVTRDVPLAEDVVQEAFLRFFRRARSFDASRPFAPYFFRMVVNAALDATQKEWKKVPLDAGCDDAGLDDLLAHAVSVEAQVDSHQLRESLQAALSRLSPRQRAVIVRRYYLEMSEAEMAEDLEIAPGTVKWLLNAARTRLRALLGTERSL